MHLGYRTGAAAALAAIFALSGCSSGSGAPGLPPGPPGADAHPHASPLKHIVIVIQENRSFNNFFAGYPGATSSMTGLNHLGKTVQLVQATLVDRDEDMSHEHHDFETSYNGGKMNGFDLTPLGVTGQPAGNYPYQYVDRAEIAPYWALAKRYVLADHFFQTQSSGSFTAHQDLIAGGTQIDKTHSVIDLPSRPVWGCDAPAGTTTTLINTQSVLTGNGPFPCFGYASLRDLLDAKHISWKYYTPPVASKLGGVWNAFDAIRAVRYDAAEWSSNVSSPETNVFGDIKAGKLPSVAWVIPDYQNSDHPGVGSKDTGPSWVAQIVNAIGKSPYWNSTAIVVVWDDWGGFYDPVSPPQLSYDGLGFRVPAIFVSPYAKSGYVDHTQYEFGSILKFVENNWQLGTLGATDARSTPIAAGFDFTQKPRPFVPVRAKYSKAFFERQAPSNKPVDDE